MIASIASISFGRVYLRSASFLVDCPPFSILFFCEFNCFLTFSRFLIFFIKIFSGTTMIPNLFELTKQFRCQVNKIFSNITLKRAGQTIDQQLKVDFTCVYLLKANFDVCRHVLTTTPHGKCLIQPQRHLSTRDVPYDASWRVSLV